jgi:Xaa-Pro aminopeptidase
MPKDGEQMSEELIQYDRLQETIEKAGVAAFIGVSPDSTYYLSSVLIRTQVSIRDRVAFVVWPAQGDATLLVCDIEESLARMEGSIKDLRTYVEFAQQPAKQLAEILRERGLDKERLGIEARYLSVAEMSELRAALPDVELVPIDEALMSVRAIKTAAEVRGIASAYQKTEAAINTAWASSRAGDTERQIANQMTTTLLERGADGIRHMTLSSGPNTVHPHMTPADRQLQPGETLLTDIGAFFDGFASDIARMGICGSPSSLQRHEYDAYRRAQVALLAAVRPGIAASSLYHLAARELESEGFELTSPHVGHGVSRRGGHEHPMLQPRNDSHLEAGMLLAVEPGFRPRPDQRYHVEDLALVTDDGAEVLTDWRSTAGMIPIAT